MTEQENLEEQLEKDGFIRISAIDEYRLTPLAEVLGLTRDDTRSYRKFPPKEIRFVRVLPEFCSDAHCQLSENQKSFFYYVYAKW